MKNEIFTFRDPNFAAALVAFQLCKAGKEVVIELSEKPAEDYQPEFTNYYPMKLTDVVSANLDYRFLNQIAGLFPHLVFRQRVYFFDTSTELSAKFLAATDKLLGYDREMASFPTNPSKLFNTSTTQLQKGAQVIEYRFDRNRAIFELLQQCKKTGAQINIANEESSLENLIHSTSDKTFSDIIEAAQLPIQNAVLLNDVNFTIQLNNVNGNVAVCILPSNNQFEKAKAIELLKEVGLSIDDSIFKKEQTAKETFVVEELLTHDLRNGWTEISSQFRKQFNLSKSIFSLPKANEKLPEYYAKLQMECEQKYDMAKQTGIQFRVFEQLFYRYIAQIDFMIEEAYEKMSIERDPEKLWNLVLQEIQEKEWQALVE